MAFATRPAPAYRPQSGYSRCAFPRKNDVVEARHHNLFQLLVHLLLVPEIALPVLHPFEIRNSNAAGIGQNIGNHKDLLLGQNRIRDKRGRSVGAFAKNLCLNPVRVADVITFSRAAGISTSQSISSASSLSTSSAPRRIRESNRSRAGASSTLRYPARAGYRLRRRIRQSRRS